MNPVKIRPGGESAQYVYPTIEYQVGFVKMSSPCRHENITFFIGNMLKLPRPASSLYEHTHTDTYYTTYVTLDARDYEEY